jgi:hypothetical protein
MIKTTIPMLAIWAAALGSAGALAYTLNRPVKPHTTIGQFFEAVPASMTMAANDRPVVPPNGEIDVTPTLIVHKATHARARPVAAPTHVRELSDMRCTAWQDLIQGSASQQVRRCD